MVIDMEDIARLTSDPVGLAVLNLVEAVSQRCRRCILGCCRCCTHTGNRAVAHPEIPRSHANRDAWVLGQVLPDALPVRCHVPMVVGCCNISATPSDLG